MLFGAENTSLLYISIVLIPLISVVLSKKNILIDGLFSFRSSAVNTTLQGISLFCGTFLIVLLIILPFLRFYPYLIMFSLLITAVGLFVFTKKWRTVPFIIFFTENVPFLSRVLISVTIIIFLGLFQLTALMYVGVVFGRYFFEGSLYPVIVLNVMIAGFVVLMGDSTAIAMNNVVLGILSILMVFILSLLPETVTLFSSSISEILIVQSRLIFSGRQAEWFPIVLPISIFVLVWWIWIFNDTKLYQAEHKAKATSASILITFLLIGAFIMLFIYAMNQQSVNTDDPINVSDGNSNAVLSMIIVSFLLIGTLSRTLYLIKIFSTSISFRSAVKNEYSEKDILIGRLAIVAFALFAILLYPVAVILGERLIMLNVLFIACFIVPVSTVYTMHVLWKSLTTEGVSAGISIGLISGGILFVYSSPLSLSGFSEGVHPIIISLISVSAAAVSSATVSLMTDRMKKKTEKITVPIT